MEIFFDLRSGFSASALTRRGEFRLTVSCLSIGRVVIPMGNAVDTYIRSYRVAVLITAYEIFHCLWDLFGSCAASASARKEFYDCADMNLQCRRVVNYTDLGFAITTRTAKSPSCA